MATNTNILINTSNKLIMILFLLKTRSVSISPESMQNSIIKEIAAFEKASAEAGLEEKTILAARYCLCTAIDEAVLNSPWGKDSVWLENSLLNAIHKDSWGGERFYIILDACLKDTENKDNLALIKLIYLILCADYKGKYYNANDAREHLIDTIKNNYINRELVNKSDDFCFPAHQTSGIPSKKRPPLWIFYACLGAALIIVNLSTQIILGKKIQPVIAEIDHIKEAITTQK